MPAASRLRSERGFTLIELLVAMAVCVVGIMATVGVIDASRHVVSSAEKREAMVHHAERALDEVLARPYATIAHNETETPANASGPQHPSSFVNGSGPTGTYQFDWTDPARTEGFATVADGTGLTSAQAVSQWNDGQNRLSGWVYRYVTNVQGHAKRVTVAATVNGRDAPDPVVLSSIVVEPDLST